ncbi:phage tail tape measure protein [Paroceanicella profunda]|uniref:phage tail tape measure protein n=1 Tax=Paroceanicella profunda TaxID=2579971 RepID=UPI001478B33A|nr:phage tail tape measure protein [Paroceanicella profunda]
MPTHDEILTRYTGDVTGFLRATSQYDRRLAQLDGSVRSRLDRIDARWERSARVMHGVRGVLSGLAVSFSIGSFVRDAVTAAKDFEAAMNRIGAASGAAQADLDRLAAKARELGRTTAFSASEAADAAEVLVRNGVSVQEILGGALDASLTLAAATGGQLASAADLATDVMAQFGLTARDLAQVVDIVTGAAVNSKFGFNDLAGAIAQGGAVAAQGGLDFGEFATALSLTAQAFSSGSDAGTSFNTFVTSLSGNSKEARAEIARLGLEFYDATGTLRPMSAVAEELRRALAGLSEQQRTVSLKTIFGTDAIRTAATLAEAGAAGFDTLAASIAKVSAQDQAEARMAGLEGKLKALAAAWEGVLLSLGEGGGLAAATVAVQGLTEALTALQENFPAVAAGAAAFAGARGLGALIAATKASAAAARDATTATAAQVRIAQTEVAAAEAQVVKTAQKAAVLRQLQNATNATKESTKELEKAERAATNARTRLTRATEAATRATNATAAAVARLSATTRIAQGVMTGLRGAMAFFGGPVGLAITAAAVGISALSANTERAEERIDRLSGSTGTLREAVGGLRDTQEAYRKAIATTGDTQVQASGKIIAASRQEYEAKRKLLQIETLRAQKEQSGRVDEIRRLDSEVARNDPERIAAELRAGGAGEEEIESSVGGAYARAQREKMRALEEQRLRLQVRTEEVAREIAEARSALNGVFPDAADLPPGDTGGGGDGGGGGNGGGGTDTPDTPSTAKGSTPGSLSDLLAGSADRIAALRDESAGVRRLDTDTAALEERVRLLSEARAAGIDLDARTAAGGQTVREVLEAQAEAYGKAKAGLDDLQAAAALYADTRTPEETRGQRKADIEALRPALIRYLGDEAAANEVLARAISKVDGAYADSSRAGEDMVSTLTDGLRGLADETRSAGDVILDVIAQIVSANAGSFFTALAGGASTGVGGALGSGLLGLFGGTSAAPAVSANTAPVAGMTAILPTGHAGAVIGVRASGTTRVDPRVFEGAERWHTGGTLGLKHGEVPFIGKVGEPIFPDIESAAAFGQQPRGGDSYAITVNNPTGSADEMMARLRSELGAIERQRARRDALRAYTNPRQFRE